MQRLSQRKLSQILTGRYIQQVFDEKSYHLIISITDSDVVKNLLQLTGLCPEDFVLRTYAKVSWRANFTEVDKSLRDPFVVLRKALSEIVFDLRGEQYIQYAQVVSRLWISTMQTIRSISTAHSNEIRSFNEIRDDWKIEFEKYLEEQGIKERFMFG